MRSIQSTAPTAQRAHKAARSLLFGVNDIRLNEAGAQQAVAPLHLDRQALTLNWHPGLKVTGQELGAMPASQAAYVAVSGNRADTPRTKAQRRAYVGYLRELLQAHPNIKELQVWNEPNLKYRWNGSGRSGRFAYDALLANTYDALRGTGVKVASPGAYPAMTSQVKFVQKMGRYLRASGRKAPLFDIYSTHPYWDEQKTAVLRQAMNNAFAKTGQRTAKKGLPIWWTEIGQTFPARPKNESQSDYLNYMVNSARKQNIGAVFNFLAYDEPQGGWSTGLMNSAGVQKPAFDAYMNLIQRTRAAQKG